MTELFRYQLPLHEHQLGAALTNAHAVGLVSLGSHAKFNQFREEMERVAAQGGEPASWDRSLVEPLHLALKARIDRRTALDPRFWHWLTTGPLQEFVWLRWNGKVPETPEEILTPRLAERFLGAASLHGFSRNAVARLYWTAETLWSPQDQYKFAVEALTNQDFFQAIFERKLGLFRPAAVACLQTLRGHDEKGRRDAVKRLNHYLTTVAAEVLVVDDFERLLKEDA